MASPAAAQQKPTLLDEIVVTATRAERHISDVPQTTHVVTRDEIQTQLQLTSSPSAALAKLIPGFSVSNQTISGASETFRGRDLLVMVDGVPFNTPLRDVSRILSMLDLNAMDRIEVVAGSSSLYGSGATGGTVNFITRRAMEGKPTISTNTAVRAFTQNIGGSLQPEASGVATYKDKSGFDMVAVASGRMANKTYDGAGRELPSDAMLGQGGGDRFVSGNGLLKLGYDFDATKRFELSGTWIYLNQKPDWMTNYSQPFARPDFSSPYFGESVLEDTKSFSARYTDSAFAFGKLTLLAYYNDIAKRFNYSRFDLSYNNQVYYSGNLGTPTAPFNQTTLFTKRGGTSLTIDSSLDWIWRGAKLTWGGDVTMDQTGQVLTNGQDVFSPLGQTSYAGFAQLQVPITDRLTVRGGARYEYLDLTVENFTRPAVFMGFPGIGYAVLPPLGVTGGDFAFDAATFNLGGTLKLAERWELYGGFSQGFSLPDIGAFTRRAGAANTAQILALGCFLGAAQPPPVPFNCPKVNTISYASIGPKAQIVDTYEVGLRGASGPVHFTLAGFLSTSEQGVSFDAATNRITQQAEVVYGAEFTGAWTATDHLTLGTVLRYQEGRFDSDRNGTIDSYLPNNRIGAPYRGTLYGDYRFDNGAILRLEGEGFSGRDAPISTTGTRFPIDGAFIMNAALSVPWQGGQVYLGANNIFDTAYENPTATSVRNLPVFAWGRTVTLGYRKTW